ncbi:predicted protein [Botrytis cinerea T4]|uniref:Uncharacterized protein n=1 Tax=Botryotinia fuckeliana (strain T4) TaxID=999810 RepID=G2YBY0_BOTF4|nr:predicted protein [Botrytis cinerea T4]
MKLITRLQKLVQVETHHCSGSVDDDFFVEDEFSVSSEFAREFSRAVASDASEERSDAGAATMNEMAKKSAHKYVQR